jgi:hypothetical protein
MKAAKPPAGGDDFAQLMAEAEEYALADGDGTPTAKPTPKAGPRRAPASTAAVSLAAAIHGPGASPASGRTGQTPRRAAGGAKAPGAVNNGRRVRGILNIIFGTIFIIGGLSGYLVLIGTHSGIALAVVGVLLIGFGVYRIATSRA